MTETGEEEVGMGASTQWVQGVSLGNKKVLKLERGDSCTTL